METLKDNVRKALRSLKHVNNEELVLQFNMGVFENPSSIAPPFLKHTS